MPSSTISPSASQRRRSGPDRSRPRMLLECTRWAPANASGPRNSHLSRGETSHTPRSSPTASYSPSESPKLSVQNQPASSIKAPPGRRGARRRGCGATRLPCDYLLLGTPRDFPVAAPSCGFCVDALDATGGGHHGMPIRTSQACSCWSERAVVGMHRVRPSRHCPKGRTPWAGPRVEVQTPVQHPLERTLDEAQGES